MSVRIQLIIALLLIANTHAFVTLPQYSRYPIVKSLSYFQDIRRNVVQIRSIPTPSPELIADVIANEPTSLVTRSVGPVTLSGAMKLWRTVFSRNLFLLTWYQLTYPMNLKKLYRFQQWLWRILNFQHPLPWEDSILGFFCDRGALLGRILTGYYLATIICTMLPNIGINLREDTPTFLFKLMMTAYTVHVTELFLSKFLHFLAPQLAESRRQLYVIQRTLSVMLWILCALVECELISTFLRIPLTSILAFGGVGGLALGISTRDIIGNFLGGMLLLVNEPFTPGDMIRFRSSGIDMEGRVERVGWNQVRIRAKDTKPVYIPNSQFVNAAVANEERVTHRKFERQISVQLQEHHKLAILIENIRRRLRSVPKIDTLAQPLRVHFVGFTAMSLDIDIMCYFATRQVDDFLALQEIVNYEILAAIEESGASLAVPMSVVNWVSSNTTVNPTSSPSLLLPTASVVSPKP